MTRSIVRFVAALARLMTGKSNAARMAMIAMVTINSINVKARPLPFAQYRKYLIRSRCCPGEARNSVRRAIESEVGKASAAQRSRLASQCLPQIA